MGIAILPQHELIDLIETVSPDLAPEHAELLAEKLRPALAPLDAALGMLGVNAILREAFGELLCRIGGGMEGIA
mgnify:FL=1